MPGRKQGLEVRREGASSRQNGAAPANHGFQHISELATSCSNSGQHTHLDIAVGEVLHLGNAAVERARGVRLQDEAVGHGLAGRNAGERHGGQAGHAGEALAKALVLERDVLGNTVQK